MPRQLRTDELSQEIRAKLWGVFYSWLEENVSYGEICDEAARFARQWHVEGEHKPLDEFDPELRDYAGRLKKRFFDPEFYPLFNLIEFALRSRLFPHERKEILTAIFEEGRAGWRVVGNQLVPFGSQEEAETVAGALTEIEGKASAGVKSHLRKSAEALSAGNWGDSARESISAVEAAARAFDDKKTLGQITKTLKARGKPIHPALAQSLSSLYGYASDEKGIRHSLVDEADAAVGENEAVLLYGLSVSFARYLVRLKAAD